LKLRGNNSIHPLFFSSTRTFGAINRFTGKGIAQWPVPLISVISKIGAGDVPCPIAANLLLQTIFRKDDFSDTVEAAQTEEACKT
jgi:hypothetical protein